MIPPHSKGIRNSNSNGKSKSNSNSKSNSTQQHQQQQQQKLSKTYKQPVWQAAGLAGLLFEYFQLLLDIFTYFLISALQGL